MTVAKHLYSIVSIILLMIIFIFLPYLPGDYDGLASSLSFMAQLLCYAGLIIVPIGIVWFTYDWLTFRKRMEKSLNTTYHFAMASLITCYFISLVISITIFINNNRSLGLITMVLCTYCAWKRIPQMKQFKKTGKKNVSLLPIYLICVPLLLFFTRFAFIKQAVKYSSDKAILKSEQLIQDIETYHRNNGHYPASLLSVWKDYKTSITGIKQYHYELNGNAYNLYFEQVSADLATKEIAMYNKLNEHQMTSHDQDLLLLSTAELNQQRGYFAVHDLAHRHWKRFLFD